MQSSHLLLLISASAASSILLRSSRDLASSVQTTHTSVHWAYEGHEGPDAWGRLNPAYFACGSGQKQSPIELDVSHAEHAALPTLDAHYGTTDLTETDNGHTIVDTVAPGEYLELGGVRYPLDQFHFHHPSEHTINGHQFPLEIHLVHTAGSGERFVLGVLVREGAEHPALDTLFAHIPGAHEELHASLDPAALLPDDRAYVTYAGSLTTPPCTEGVTWAVLTTPIEASPAQITRFAERYPHNNRPVMPRNGRDVRISP